MKTLRTMAAVRRELRRLLEQAVDDKQHELWRRQGDAIADAFRPLQMSDKFTEHLRIGLIEEGRQVLAKIRDERRRAAVVPPGGARRRVLGGTDAAREHGIDGAAIAVRGGAVSGPGFGGDPVLMATGQA